MLRVPVENAAHLHDRASELNLFAEDLRAIGRGENGFADVEADLAPVDVKSGNYFDVARPIRADLAVHQSDAVAVDGGAVIKIDSLHERTGAVSDADNGDSYFSHF